MPPKRYNFRARKTPVVWVDDDTLKTKKRRRTKMIQTIFQKMKTNPNMRATKMKMKMKMKMKLKTKVNLKKSHHSSFPKAQKSQSSFTFISSQEVKVRGA
jgi:hypothetical protein